MSTSAVARPGDLAVEPQRFFFVHMLKTGGTAMFLRLREHFGEDAVYPNASDGDVMTVAPQFVTATLLERWPERGADIRVMIGHLPLCTTELLGVPFTTLTMLREPVARTLSFLQFHRKLIPADADLSLDQIYDDKVRFDTLIHNHMVKMLSLTPDEMTADMLTPVEFTPERLARAKANLEQIDAVGTQDHLEDFCEAIDAAYGWHIARRVNHKGAGKPKVSRSLRKRIARDNADDIELYDHAVELIHRRGFLR
ncbi:MAG: hypothetical protein QG597_3438 [Actinomycetota bacterium]|nr:hypothetical protein [Actinomycetota bacterium]